MDAQQQHPGSALPVWESVTDSYHLFRRHLGAFLKSGWVALLIASALSAVPDAAGMPKSGAASLLLVVVAVLTLLLYATVQVSWLRILLLDEAPRHGLTLGPRERTYFKCLLLATLAAVGPAVAALVPFGIAAGKAGLLAGAFVALAYVIWMEARLSMVGPLVAVDRSDRPLRASWAGTRGLTPQLVLIPLLTLLPVYVVASLLQQAAGPALTLLLTLPLNFAVTGLVTACLAVMYARISGTPLATAT